MSIFHRKGKPAQPAPVDPEIGRVAYGQAKPVNHPGATYEMAYRTQDATLAGIGRRVAKTKR
ncbi:hypothetical protein [Micromonospora carbonacea]|uniref:Uncharacterized protein n=1 Tax=Micromonospora carbonacea TaxID=47853 RepID=A0A1C5A3C5_9ACTN|nr:hypothetical protein [Micromonospora carbonacea]SCF39646.1 hypothetical protein GA0070563_11147 [Micromonospora carbonacea]